MSLLNNVTLDRLLPGQLSDLTPTLDLSSRFGTVAPDLLNSTVTQTLRAPVSLVPDWSRRVTPPPVLKLLTAPPSTCSSVTSSSRRAMASLTTCQTTWFCRSSKNSRCRSKMPAAAARSETCSRKRECFLCSFISDYQLWQRPADCTEHRQTSPRPCIRPQLYVSFCTVCLWQWSECKRCVSCLCRCHALGV